MVCRTGHSANAFRLAAGSSSGADHAARVPRPPRGHQVPPSPTYFLGSTRSRTKAAADGQNGVTWAGGELEDLYRARGELTEAWRRYTAAARLNPDTSAFPTAAPSSTRHVVADGTKGRPRRRVATWRPRHATRRAPQASGRGLVHKRLLYETPADRTVRAGTFRVHNACPKSTSHDLAARGF